MSIIFKISQRNLLRHRGKSIVIGLILFMGALFMTLGNAIVNGMNKGLEENLVQRFLGHIIVFSTNQLDDNILTGIPKPMKVMAGYKDIKALLDDRPEIDQYLPAGYGMSMIFNPDGDRPLVSLMIGVDFDAYQKMFHSNISVIEGAFPTNGQKGILINTESQKRFYDDGGFWIVPVNYPLIESNLSPAALSNVGKLIVKSNLIIQGMSAEMGSLDIRADIVSIFKFETLNQVWDVVNFMDIATYRECFGYFTSADAKIVLKEEEKSILSAEEDDINSMFSEDSMFEDAQVSSKDYSLSELKKQTQKTEEDVSVIDSGSYNLIYIKLKPDAPNDYLDTLNKLFKDAGMDARATSWDKAAGQIGQFANIFRLAINSFVMILFFVAIIIIMNTLSMAAMERISEIGMMRAVGANKGFIARMFLVETFILSFLFGSVGMLLGTLIQRLVRIAHIKADGNMQVLLFGGDYLQPFLDPGTVFFCILQLLLVTLLSVIYPIIVARKITPLDAISRN
ncbi:MAG: hypothetical protein A2Y33_09885 [Spirochaetes bacterium GWF1_51_8]|nr:MAG: hypothetical protein A2Y33_09885 [Spirochaetes bacterium GWF1_51_8]